MSTTHEPNREAVETWDTILFEKWNRFRWVLTSGLRVHGDAAMARLAPAPGERILDVGCGYGDTTIELARAVGPTGTAVGVDAAKRFIEAARVDHVLPNLRFEVREVQIDDVGGPYDAAFSRFGTMFFASAVAALRNVRRALVPGGRLCMVVWRKRQDNDWLYAAQQVVERLVPPDEKDEGPTCGPGPFSMAGPDMVSDQLGAAGFREISFERFDAPISLGRNLDEALEFALALGPAGEMLRLAGERAADLRPVLTEQLREAFRAFEREDGIWAPSSTWIVRATAAGD